MKNTRVAHLAGFAIPAATAAFLFGQYRVGHGQSLPVAGASQLVLVLVIVLALLLLAYPIYRYRRALLALTKAQSKGESTLGGKRPKRLDPFYAVRVLLLAKATGLALSLYLGWHTGLVLLQLSLPVQASGLWQNLAAAVLNLLGVVVAAVVERLCRIPGGTDDTAIEGSEANPA